MMLEQPPAQGDGNLRRFREYVAAGIALTVVFGTVVLIGLTFIYIGQDEAFSRAKDLLLIVNPFVGVVIGYYFNKVSTEARAESAEGTARSATANAQQAAEGRQKAEAEARQNWNEMQDAKAILSEVSLAAEQMLAQAPGRVPGALGVSESGDTTEDARTALQIALARAKRVTG